MSCPKGHIQPSPDVCRLCRAAMREPGYFRMWWPELPFPRTSSVQNKPQKEQGPGTELGNLLALMGIHPPDNCDCKAKARQMDRWGVEGCKQNRETILIWIRQGQQKWGWAARLGAAARAIRAGMTFLNPLDPIPSLVDEAIRLAEEKEKAKPSLPEEKLVTNERRSAPTHSPSLRWAYGVMTVDEEERRSVLLPQTLGSLAAAGFDNPRLFVDGKDRVPRIRCAGNWLLSILELYLREPNAERYALFQDDLITYRNLRTYLERSPYPDKGYLNLYTFPANEYPRHNKAPKDSGFVGWYESNGKGLGALALVFSKPALLILLSSRHLYERAQDVDRGHRAIDGGVVEAMKHQGWKEYVHSPSLTQHTGMTSTMNKQQAHQHNPNAPPYKWDSCTLANGFRGADFDAMELLAEVRR